MLEARHLTKRYFGVTAVDDVSFVVRAGEVVGYLGANGSGKSTTARMLTQLLEPTSGSVWLDGRDARGDVVAYRRRLGYVPEEPHLYPFLSGLEYLELVGGLRNLPASLLARKIGAFVELLGLDAVARQSISAYSKGTRQKILIAAALLHDPDVLVFDEPESGLDVGASLVLRHLLRVLSTRGKAILYSSHVLDSAEKICTRVLVLHAGRIVADGPVGAARDAVGASLEDVFEKLGGPDPADVAEALADVVALRG